MAEREQDIIDRAVKTDLEAIAEGAAIEAALLGPVVKSLSGIAGYYIQTKVLPKVINKA